MKNALRRIRYATNWPTIRGSAAHGRVFRAASGAGRTTPKTFRLPTAVELGQIVNHSHLGRHCTVSPILANGENAKKYTTTKIKSNAFQARTFWLSTIKRKKQNTVRQQFSTHVLGIKIIRTTSCFIACILR